MMIDAHQHFWKYDPAVQGWIDDEMQMLRKDFMPSDFKPILDENGIGGCVAVQADQTERETDFLLELASQHDFIKGVVGWLDLQADDIDEKLNRYHRHPFLKGLRHTVQDERDDRFLLRPDFRRGMQALQEFNLTYDILIFHRHLPVAAEFASGFPGQKFVLDHIAKPEIKSRKIDTWEKGIRELAGHPNMYCKISGMVTEADWEYSKPEDFRPYLDVIFDAFSPDRVMFGSDWPVCTLAASYKQVLNIVRNYIQQFSPEKRKKIIGENAREFYNL
jgi:L-fuconolactonase